MSTTTHTRVRIAAALVALAIVTFFTIQGSLAAFSDTTSNDSSSFAAGTVILVDDDSGSAMFTMAGMAPGDIETECIVVTYNGSLQSDVVLYVSPGDLTGTDLDDYLDLTVERSVGGSGVFGDCTGFSGNLVYDGTLDGFATAYTDFSNGALWMWADTGDYSVYRFTIELQDDNAAQGLNSAVTFTWEAQNR